MNRQEYFNYVERKLNELAVRIDTRAKLNLLDLNIHSESFYLHLINKIMTWSLESLNTTVSNTEAIDLADHVRKIILQISSTSTKAKIESSLSKINDKYENYKFKFLSISKDASNLRTLSYKNPSKATFNPQEDTLDIRSLLSSFLNLDIATQREIYEQIRSELEREIPSRKTETNLAQIINVLAQLEWSESDLQVEVIPYKIEDKIKHNDLDTAQWIVSDYKIHNSRLDKIYTEFDRQGANKSRSVLHSIRTIYHKNRGALSGDELFYKITEQVELAIQESANYTSIPKDELCLCVNILVVDAFIRCKIFENPEGYEANVAAR